MPLYEYECSVCGHRFEVLQKFSDNSISVCTRCGGAVSRLISSSAIQFKGTGWYVTDYAGKGAAGSESKGNGKGEPEGEEAPAPSPQAKPSKEPSNPSGSTSSTD